MGASAKAQEWRVNHTGSAPEVLREPRPLREECGPRRGIVLDVAYFPLKGQQPDGITVKSVIETGCKCHRAAGFEVFPQHMWEKADRLLHVVGVGKEKFKVGTWIIRAQASVAIEGSKSPMMARCTEMMIYLAAIGPRAILSYPFLHT